MFVDVGGEYVKGFVCKGVICTYAEHCRPDVADFSASRDYA